MSDLNSCLMCGADLATRELPPLTVEHLHIAGVRVVIAALRDKRYRDSDAVADDLQRAIGNAKDAQPPAVGVDVSEGFVLAPSYRGYAHLGTGSYLLLHSHADDEAELCIVPASESEKQGRKVGDLSDDGPEEVSAERMAVRIRFENVAGLDALEQQLRLLRQVHFAALRTGGGES